MEIINKKQQNPLPEREAKIRQIYLGAALILIGLIWILHNFDLIGYRFFDLFFSWQMLLVVIGGYLLAIRRWCGGAIVTGVGLCFMITDLLHLCIPFNKVVLPVICIAAGLAVLFARKNP